ncbi:MAG: GNAT family N-acetyltransferase [Candidatus Thorarchaeota archaeon]
MDISIVKDKDNFEGIIRPIDTNIDSQKLADFFNAIDDLWPGTWTQGIMYDEKRAQEFIEKRKALVWFVAFDPHDRLVGLCSVHKRMEEPNVSYIGILGVHPEVLGKKYGKHLLLTAVDFSVKNGDVRQDLHTWASNMKAVPLYKKIGLQWVPNTSVYMQNYIPVILQNSFCKLFFDKHPDWYLDQKRDINQAPDEQTLGSMKVFYYRFEKGEDFLEVIVDRYSRSIASITRKIDGELIGITLQQKDHDVFAGIEHNISFVIRNESNKELSVVVYLEGSEEISVKASQEILTVPKGSKTLEITYVVDDITFDTDIQRKTPSIKGQIIIDGEVLTLEAGMKVRQIIDIMISDRVWWRPSGKQTISIQVQNRSEKPIKGDLVFWTINEIEILSPIIPIKLAPEENTGVDAQVAIPASDTDIFTTLYCQVKMGDVRSRVFELPIFFSNSQGLAAGFQQDKKCVIIQNQYIRGILKLEGASADFRTPDETLMGIGLRTLDYGPPFGFSEFNQVEFSPKIIKKRNSIQVRLSRRGQSKGELYFHRVFELKAGDHHFSTWTEVQNLGTVDDQITMIIEPHFTHGINMPLGETYFVFEDQLVCGPAFLWPAGKGDLPRGTEKYEPWICIQVGDVCYYHIYETHDTKADPSRNKMSSLEKQIRIPALSSSQGPKSWIGCGNIVWKRVRELAYFLSKNEVLSPIHQNLEAKPYLSVDIPKNQLYIGNKHSEIQITLKSFRLMPLNGHLIIVVPEGWTITPNKFEIINLNLNNPQEFKCELDLSNNVIFGTYNLKFIIESPEKRETKHIQFLVFDGSEKPEILDLPPESNKKLILVKNNTLELTSSGDFAACLTQIRYNGKPYLLSNFPNFSPSVFFSKDPGGMVNSIFQSENDDLDDPSYLKEKYIAKKIQSDHWSGVEYSSTLHEIKSLKGLAVKIVYEILGGDSSLIRVRTTVHNPTSTKFRFLSLSLLSPGINGSIENMISRFSTGTKIPFYVSRDNPVPIFGAGSKEMTYITLTKDINSLSVIKTSLRSKLVSLDAGKMILGAGFLTFWSLEPNQTDEVSYFVSLDSKEEFLKNISQMFCEN